MGRKDEARLLDMLKASRNILEFTAGYSKVEFEQDELVQSGVIRQLQIIGEAARTITDELKSAHNQVAWSEIIGMRTIVIHRYFDIDLDFVWETVLSDIPLLIKQLEAILP
jgi:uncharacterized protein with HEPN domain